VFEDGFINSISPAGKPKAKVQEVEVDDEPAPVKRSEKELKAELGYASPDTDNVDEILVDEPKKAKKAAKKVVVDPDSDDDL
jgi:hypothetical protein